MNHIPSHTTYKKNALLLTIALALVGLASFSWIILHSIPSAGNTTDSRNVVFPSELSSGQILVADIYQNGNLLQSITLSAVKESYRITITGEHDATNEIEVRPGSIGIVSASCPDKLCVHQGFIESALLPITCLPNRLVIQVRRETLSENGENAPDIITY